MPSENFKQLGLNKYQSEILYSLLQLGEAKASELAKITDIGRVRVYDILNELYTMGIIKKIEARPTKYIAFSPEQTVDKILEWEKKQYLDKKAIILKNKKKIKKELGSIYKKNKTKPRNMLELISLGDVSERETKTMINQAKEIIKIMSGVLEYIDAIEHALNITNARIHVLLQSQPKMERIQDKAVQKLKKAGADIRYYKEIPLRGCIVDSSNAILNVKDRESSNLLRNCIYTSHQSFVKAMDLYFDKLWDSAESK